MKSHTTTEELKRTETRMKYLRPVQVAEQTGLTLSFIRKLIGRRQLPAYRIGRAVLVSQDDLDLFISARRVEAR
jgi:excisionase family DNA binding protein